jgi:hypothetical protein
MLSPGLAALNRDSFVANESPETTVDLDGHRAPFQLDELALDDEPDAEAVVPAVRLPPAPAIRLWAGGPRSASRLPLSPFSRAVDPAREVGPGARRQPRRHATMRHR